MKIEFLSDADEEFREAARFYETHAAGVGLTFVAEVHRTLSRIVSHPAASKVVRGDIRQKQLPHFPYSLLYTIESDTVLVIAVAHNKRRPSYWRARTPRGGRNA